MTIVWLRDLAIVILAVSGTAVGILLIVLGIMLYRRLRSILDSVKVIVANAQSTSTVVSESVIKPIIAASSWVQGIRHAIAVIGELSRGRRKKGE
jgi:uncharacterized membrane protein